MRTSLCLRLLGLLGLCIQLGCVTANHAYPRWFSGAPAQLPTASAITPFSSGDTGQAPSVTGVWRGISQADCMGITVTDPGRCHATQNIELTLIQQDDIVTGFYKCSYGTEICRNLDEAGLIRNGSMEHGRLQMRVMLEDGSMCFFTSHPLRGVLEGRYSCLQGAGIVERGAFKAVLNF